MSIVALAPQHDGRHDLGGIADARESLAYILSLPEEEIGVIVYTWVSGAGKAGSLLVVHGPGVGGDPIVEAVDGVDVPADRGFDDWRVGGITVRLGEPLVVADVAFEGEKAGITYRFEGLHPAFAYGAHRGGCPWYLADDRFEQSGRVSGVLRIGDREIPYDTTAHRDHSWGTRDWGAPLHWKWILAQVGPDVGVHVMETEALGRHELRGYVHRDGVTAQVVGVEGATFELDEAMVQRSWSGRVLDDAGRTTDVVLRAHSAYEFAVSPELTLNEVGMAAEIDGRSGTGHVEMAWPPPYLERNRGARG